jgi:hypothetical protein
VTEAGGAEWELTRLEWSCQAPITTSLLEAGDDLALETLVSDVTLVLRRWAKDTSSRESGGAGEGSAAITRCA